jgi:hypothetical protein
MSARSAGSRGCRGRQRRSLQHTHAHAISDRTRHVWGGTSSAFSRAEPVRTRWEGTHARTDPRTDVRAHSGGTSSAALRLQRKLDAIVQLQELAQVRVR